MRRWFGILVRNDSRCGACSLSASARSRWRAIAIAASVCWPCLEEPERFSRFAFGGFVIARHELDGGEVHGRTAGNPRVLTAEEVDRFALHQARALEVATLREHRTQIVLCSGDRRWNVHPFADREPFEDPLLCLLVAADREVFTVLAVLCPAAARTLMQL